VLADKRQRTIVAELKANAGPARGWLRSDDAGNDSRRSIGSLDGGCHARTGERIRDRWQRSTRSRMMAALGWVRGCLRPPCRLHVRRAAREFLPNTQAVVASGVLTSCDRPEASTPSEDSRRFLPGALPPYSPVMSRHTPPPAKRFRRQIQETRRLQDVTVRVYRPSTR
jgi:hypothetical protein